MSRGRPKSPVKRGMSMLPSIPVQMSWPGTRPSMAMMPRAPEHRKRSADQPMSGSLSLRTVH